MTEDCKKLYDSLACELIDDIKRACAVGRTRIVAKAEVVVLRHQLAHTVKYCQPSIAGVEHTYWSWFVC